MSIASQIKDKILNHGIGEIRAAHTLERFAGLNEEQINRIVLIPFCVIDIAYRKWQEKVVNIPEKQELKIIKKRVQNLFEKCLYNTKGCIYGGLNEDEICFMSDYSDKIYNAIQRDLQIHFYALQEKLMDIPTEHRNVICDILEMQTILVISQSNLFSDLNIKYPALDNTISALLLLENKYRQYNLGKQDRESKKKGKNNMLQNNQEFSKDDINIVNSLKIIVRKIYEVTTD